MAVCIDRAQDIGGVKGSLEGGTKSFVSARVNGLVLATNFKPGVKAVY